MTSEEKDAFHLYVSSNKPSVADQPRNDDSTEHDVAITALPFKAAQTRISRKQLLHWLKLNLQSTYEYLKSFKTEEKRNVVWWIIFWSVTVLGIATRLHYITMPNKVVWDEAHFGKFVGWYLNRTFYFDVHPPGGKLLLAFFGYISGYNGTLDFIEPGMSYGGYDSVIYMRVWCALMGAGMIPLAFLTVWTLTNNLVASLFSALFVIYEIGTLALSKFILLDSLLMFFMMSSFHGLSLFSRESCSPWTVRWWASLIYTGVSLGCVMTVKFVGVFTVLVVGLYTVADLWLLYGDIRLSLKDAMQHLFARALGLILVPVAVYVGFFFIHDQVLYASAPPMGMFGDLGVGQYTPHFQMRLVNSSLYNLTQPREVSYGSIVTLRNDYLGGGYLHSHNLTYPKKYIPGKLQQVTTMRGKDHYNLFRILYPLDDPENENGFYGGEIESVLHDSWIRLHHIATNVTVTCHYNKSLMATKLKLVYGRYYNLTDPEVVMSLPEEDSNQTITNVNFPYDIWRVKVENGKEDEPIIPMQTRFQLINAKHFCAIAWSREKYPMHWAAGQGEVACTRNLRDPYTFWIIEEVNNPYDNNTVKYNSTIGFWERFIETHQVMMWVNARLKPEIMEDGHLAWMWPILYRGQPWFDVEFRIVLLGNPFIFLLNFFALCGAPLYLLWHAYTKCRQPATCGEEEYSKPNEMASERTVFAVRWLLISYLFHYVPFIFMNRILYFHHYFPALQFSSMLTAILMTVGFERLSKSFRSSLSDIIWKGCILSMVILLTVSFVLYCYVAYGVPTQGSYNPDNSTFRHLRFVDKWEI